MLFRLKSYFVSLLAFLAVAVFTFETALPVFVWLDHTYPDQLSMQLIGAALWVAAANLIFVVIVRVLRCPECKKHFGWSNYFRQGLIWPLPSRYCPKCSADMFSGEHAKPRSEPGGLSMA